MRSVGVGRALELKLRETRPMQDCRCEGTGRHSPAAMTLLILDDAVFFMQVELAAQFCQGRKVDRRPLCCGTCAEARPQSVSS